MIGNTRVVLISEDLAITEKVVQQMQLVGLTIDNVVESATEIYKINQEVPTIVLLVEPDSDITISDVTTALRERHRQLAIVLLLKNISFSVMREALKAGAVDVLRLPDELSLLEKTVREGVKQVSKSDKTVVQQQDSSRGTGGKVYAFYSVKGGSGTTFLAANTAQSLRIQTGKRVLVIDLCFQFGGLNRTFNLQGQRSIADLDPVIHELDETHISNVLFTVEPSGLNVLLGPAQPEIAELLGAEHIELLLRACRRYFDYIFLDLPSEITPVTLAALNHSDQVFYIITPDSPSLFALKGAHDFFIRQGMMPGNKFSLLINKVSRVSDLNPNDIKKVTGMPVIGDIRANYKAVKQQINVGKPLFENLQERVWNSVARDIAKIAKQLAQ